MSSIISIHVDHNIQFSKLSMKKTEEPETADFKQLREKNAAEIRKTNRQEIFSKRRNIISEKGEDTNAGLTGEFGRRQKMLIVDPRFQDQIEKFLKRSYSMDEFSQLLQNILEGDILKQHYGLIGIRKILSIAQNPPIQPVIDAGLVPRMIDYVQQQEYPQLQLEATWALTNVASGTNLQCQSIIDKGGIPLFVGLLNSSSPGIVEQAIWAIGNISSDCSFYRDAIIRAGGLLSLVHVVETSPDPIMIKHGCWAISNLCRGNPLPKYDTIKMAIPLLCKIIATGKINDKQIIADVCWAISYHSEAQKTYKLAPLMDAKLCPKVVQYLSDSYVGLVVPCVRIVGNISTGTIAHTEQLLKYDVLTPLQKLLDHGKKVIRRQTTWVLSNIAAGTKQQVQAIISRPTLIKKLISMFEIDTVDVKRQICYIFANITHSGDEKKIYAFFLQHNLLQNYIRTLESEDAKLVQVCLECLGAILALGDRIRQPNQKNPLVLQLHSMGCVDLLEKLQYHKSDAVYENVSKILQAYFQIQDPLQI